MKGGGCGKREGGALGECTHLPDAPTRHGPLRSPCGSLYCLQACWAATVRLRSRGAPPVMVAMMVGARARAGAGAAGSTAPPAAAAHTNCRLGRVCVSTPAAVQAGASCVGMPQLRRRSRPIRVASQPFNPPAAVAAARLPHANPVRMRIAWMHACMRRCTYCRSCAGCKQGQGAEKASATAAAAAASKL